MSDGYIIEGTVKMPAGTYVIGDPCYSIKDEDWIPWLEAADYTKSHVMLANVEGQPVLGLGTAYGDGCYHDQKGNQYPVDAGMIGLVPLEIAEASGDYRPDLSNVVDFPRPFKCSRKEDGTLTFGDIVIKTGDDDEEDE